MGQFATGQPVPRTEDPRLLTGRGHFTDDVNIAHQAYAVFVRSPYPHADILAIDSTAAAAMPGVAAILSGAEYAADGLGEITGGTPHKRRDGATMYRPPRPALTNDRVRHVGQAVVMVIAETINQAKDAAEAIEIDYGPLPSVLSTELGNAPDAPEIWPDCANNESFFFERGDKAAVDAAFAGAAHIVKQKFVINRVIANPMEPRAAVGQYDAGEDRYTIHVGHQRPYAWRTTLTKNLFKISENKLRLITGDVGGSFGMKGAIFPEIPLVAWASKRLGRAVKWTAERSEGFVADDHARDNVSNAELALDADGKFLGLRVATNANLGAYMAFMGFGPSTGNIGGLAGVYATPAIYVSVAGVLTNTSPISPYRGAGRPEASYVIERLIHIAAREVGIDAAELRRRNLVPPSAMPYQTPLTFNFDSGEFEAVMEKCLGLADYASFEERRAEAAGRGRLRGIGISSTIEQAAAPQTETAEMRFDPSGTLTVLVGTTPHGQGHETIYKQLICEKLGLAPEDIRVVEGDTDKVSFGTGTGGSRSATIGTSAVFEAVGKIIDKGRKIAAHALEAAAADIELADGTFTIVGTDKSITFAEVAKAAFVPGKLPKGMEPGLYETATYNPTKANFPNGCHVCEIEIDPETGKLAIERYQVVHDVGFELNPLLVRGQIHGGVMQGVGQALMENAVYDSGSGQLISGSFMDYCMPRADDLCEISVESHSVPTATNPLGVKGAGECGTVGALACVMNALNDALAPLGIRHLDMPATPDRVWRAIRDAST